MTDEELSEHYDRCEWDDCCDFCDSPEGGTWGRIIGYEYKELDYEVCGKCAPGVIAQEQAQAKADDDYFSSPDFVSP